MSDKHEQKMLVCASWTEPSPIPSIKGNCGECNAEVRYDVKNDPRVQSGEYQLRCIPCLIKHAGDPDQRFGGGLIGGQSYEKIPDALAAVFDRVKNASKEDA